MGFGDDPASASLQVLFQMIANMLVEEFKLVYNLDKEIKELEKDVKMIGATLRDNEDTELSEAIKLWLAELRDVAYDAIDALDEYYYEKQRRTLIPFAKTRNALGYGNPKRIHCDIKISHKIKDVASSMGRIFKRRENLGLRLPPSSSRGMPSNSHIESTSSLPPILTVGREKDKQEVVRKLISQNYQGADSIVSMLAVHGVCGIGKTALVQMVYNDNAVSKHFDLKLWVNMSQEFDFEKITRSIIESCDHGLPIVGTNLHSLQMELEKRIKGRRYLLVLDDFWHENRHDWEKLKIPLYKGAVGSRILVTTRSGVVVKMIDKMVDTLGSYPLRGLPDDECYSLVSQYASGRDNDLSNDLNGLRKEILNKCRGIPMEAISLGNRLHQENERGKWRETIQREDEFLDDKKNFMRSIRLTYSRLPLNLKPCFSYCSIIPKGTRLEKEWLVQLWMAQGFIPPRNGRNIEDVGNDYFDSLERRSFFQRVWANHNGDRHEYHISDEIHKVSCSISNDECYIFESPEHDNFKINVVRHMSFIIKDDTSSNVRDSFRQIFRCKGLYTLLVVDGSLNYHHIKVPKGLADHLASLRTLDFSNCNLTSLPKSIGDLKHLRNLQLRNTKIKELPESVGHLYNMQVLGLRNCFLLRQLPHETRRLRNLRHLDLHLDVDHFKTIDYCLESMPPEIGLITNLQVLPRFVVTKKAHCGISELGSLNSLHGELLISNLNLVGNPEDAVKAKLENKQYIQRLGLVWTRKVHVESSLSKNIEVEMKVLEKLKPNENIEELNIIGYGGEVLPSWIGSSYLLNLQILCISDCKTCTQLPPLGDLPLLKDLSIKGMDSLKFVNCSTVCGTGCNPFPSLKKLSLDTMESLEYWSGQDKCKLQCLDELVLKGCPNLHRISHNLPLLTKLIFEKTPQFSGLRKYPSLKYLDLCASGEWIWSSWRCLSTLFSLTLNQLSVKSLPTDLPRVLNSLKQLEISYCENLVQIPDNWIPSNLTYFRIKHCPNLLTLPRGIGHIKTLEDLEIEECKLLEYLPEFTGLKSLTRLEISRCHSLVLTRDGLPSNLNFLSISDCPLFSLQFGDMQSLGDHFSSLWIDGKKLSSSSKIQGESSRR